MFLFKGTESAAKLKLDLKTLVLEKISLLWEKFSLVPEMFSVIWKKFSLVWDLSLELVWVTHLTWAEYHLISAECLANPIIIFNKKRRKSHYTTSNLNT